MILFVFAQLMHINYCKSALFAMRISEIILVKYGRKMTLLPDSPVYDICRSMFLA